MLRPFFMIVLLLVFCSCGAWGLEVPRAYERLGHSLEQERVSLKALEEQPYFKVYRSVIDDYERRLAEAFRIGLQLDAAAAEHRDGRGRLGREYLQRLRKLQKLQLKLRRIYAEALQYAMEQDDRPLFEALLLYPLQPLENHRIRERVKAYYEPKRSGWRPERAEALMGQMAYEAESRAAYLEELRAYEARTEVTISETEPKQKRRVLKAFKNLLLYMVDKGDGYEVYAENGNVYSVTLVLRFVHAKNIAFGGGKSVTVELLPKSTSRVRTLTPIDRRRPTAFELNMTMAMGMVSARHDDSVIYRLPFAAGKRVTVTQGYGGKATHRGASTYAVDFEASVGTPIYAARAGTVVAVESGHNRSGYDKSYSRFANYILIEHADHTFAEYAHLMQRGVTVGIGRKVRAGELIGYSGNTGYTNGPHLHFEVLKVESAVTGSTVSLPVRMRSGGNIVTHPKKGDSYTVNVSQ